MEATWLVTGAFGYSGSHVARRLLAAGHRVRTLTRSTGRRSDLRSRVEVFPLDFADPVGLRRALDGVDVLVNTYWVRFTAAGFSQEAAVRRTQVLFSAAQHAGVSRVVHVSITNPSPDSPYEYFRGKARLESALAASGLPHTILRPAVFFGGADVLLNNIAWLLRTFPVFAVPGRGDYRLQPIHVDDFAELVVAEGAAAGMRTLDAVGPETWTFEELVRLLGRAVGRPRPIVHVPPGLVHLAARWLGRRVGDVVLTREEIDALMDDLLVTASAPTGRTRLGVWALEHGATLGRRYASELARRRDRDRAYGDL